MNLSTKKSNYLTLPLIEEYYDLQEILLYYYSVKIVNEKRDLYNSILEYSYPFLEIDEIENNIQLLNNSLFSKDIKTIKKKATFSKTEIRNLNPKGFGLLNIDIPFNRDELKKAFKKAARKHHPDVGGNEEDMKALNNANTLYNEFLSWEQTTKLDIASSEYYTRIKNAETFYAEVFGLLISIFVDIWELEKAKKLIKVLTDSDFFNSGICLNNFSYRVDLFKQLNELAQKLTNIDNYSEAEKIFQLSLNFQKEFQYDGMDYEFEVTQKIISREKKHRITVRHILQAENAYKIKAITEKRYEEYIKKIQDTASNNKKLEKELKDFLSKNDVFIKLPHDENIIFTDVKKFIPHISYFESKDISLLSKEQQCEYYFTFYLEPSISSIRKYLFVRFSSYIISINTYEAKLKYLSKIIDECHFFERIFKKDNFTYKSLNQHTKKIISDLDILFYTNKETYESKYKEIFKIYYEFLPIVKKPY